jgi:hypothetical protein
VRNLKKKEKKIKQLVNDLWFETMGYKIIMKTKLLKMGLFPFLFLHGHRAFQFVIF